MKAGQFVRQIVGAGGGEDAVLFILDHLRDWVCVGSFTSYPHDIFSNIFGIAEDGLDEDMILGVIRRLGLSVKDVSSFRFAASVDMPVQIAKLAAGVRKSVS